MGTKRRFLYDASEKLKGRSQGERATLAYLETRVSAAAIERHVTSSMGGVATSPTACDGMMTRTNRISDLMQLHLSGDYEAAFKASCVELMRAKGFGTISKLLGIASMSAAHLRISDMRELMTIYETLQSDGKLGDLECIDERLIAISLAEEVARHPTKRKLVWLDNVIGNMGFGNAYWDGRRLMLQDICRYLKKHPMPRFSPEDVSASSSPLAVLHSKVVNANRDDV